MFFSSVQGNRLICRKEDVCRKNRDEVVPYQLSAREDRNLRPGHCVRSKPPRSSSTTTMRRTYLSGFVSMNRRRRCCCCCCCCCCSWSSPSLLLFHSHSNTREERGIEHTIFIQISLMGTYSNCIPFLYSTGSNTRFIWIKTSYYRSSGGSTFRIIIKICKPHTTVSKVINVGCFNFPAITPNIRIPQIIRQYQNDVGR